MNIEEDVASDQRYLGWLLILFVIPGYIATAWESIKAYLEVVDTLYGKAKDRAELVAACRGCVGLRGGDNDRNRTKAGGSRGRVAPLPESEVEDTQVSYL